MILTHHQNYALKERLIGRTFDILENGLVGTGERCVHWGLDVGLITNEPMEC